MMTRRLPTFALLWLALAVIAGRSLPVQGFAPSFRVTTTITTTRSTTRLSPLQASAGKNKRRRRRRTTTTTATEPVKENAPTSPTEQSQRAKEEEEEDDDEVAEIISEKEELNIETTPGFEFQPPKADPPIVPDGKYC